MILSILKVNMGCSLGYQGFYKSQTMSNHDVISKHQSCTPCTPEHFYENLRKHFFQFFSVRRAFFEQILQKSVASKASTKPRLLAGLTSTSGGLVALGTFCALRHPRWAVWPGTPAGRAVLGVVFGSEQCWT